MDLRHFFGKRIKKRIQILMNQAAILKQLFCKFELSHNLWLCLVCFGLLKEVFWDFCKRISIGKLDALVG